MTYRVVKECSWGEHHWKRGDFIHEGEVEPQVIKALLRMKAVQGPPYDLPPLADQDPAALPEA